MARPSSPEQNPSRSEGEQGTEAGSGAPASARGAQAPPSRAGEMVRRVRRALGSSIGIVAFVAFWTLVAELYVGGGSTSSTLLPSPAEVAGAGVEMIRDGTLVTHVLASLKRVLIAFVVASAIAIPLGLAMGWYRPLLRQLDPVVEFFRPIPPLAWIPLSILWFGTGDRQNEFIIFLGVFFPVLVNTIASVRGLDPILIRAGKSLGARGLRMFRKVVLPGALPGIFTGLRVGLGNGWMALVAAELVAASSGLGFLINDSRFVFRTDRILLGMVVIGIIGLLMDRVLRTTSRRMLPWYIGSR